MHSNWLKLVKQLPTSTSMESALFQGNAVMLNFVHGIGFRQQRFVIRIQ